MGKKTKAKLKQIFFVPKWQKKLWGIMQKRTIKYKIKQNMEEL